MNKIEIIGNLVKDAELSETANGVKVCKFSVAVNRPKFGDKEGGCDYFNCIAWRSLADAVAKFTSKGKKVAVIGSIQMRIYEGKGGEKKQMTELIASEVEFISTGESKGKAKLQPCDDDEENPF